MGNGRNIHPLVLLLLFGAIVLTVATRFINSDFLSWFYLVTYPLIVGSFGRALIAEVDEAHVPEKDYPMWFYLAAWIAIGVMAFPIWSRTLYLVAVFGNYSWLYAVAIGAASALNPWIPIRPATTLAENGDET